MGDPDETKKIRLRKPKDKITRGEFAQRRRSCKTLHSCGENLCDRVFIDVHFEAGTGLGEILSLS